MKKFAKAGSYLLLGIISLISLTPFYFMVVMSTYKTENIFKGLPLLPSNYMAENIKTVFASNFVQTYGNSLFISAMSMLVCVLVSAMMGYAMTVYQFRFKKLLKSFLMLTMMAPTQIGIIGYMIEMRTIDRKSVV